MSVKPQGENSQNFYDLKTEQVFQAAEEWGYSPSGRYFQLNSYENRVYDLFLEGETKKDHIIAKVYRPHRWSEESIAEEHEFLFDLKNQGIPAVAPVKREGQSYLKKNGMIFSFFPKALGRMPQELQPQDLRQIGRQLAKLHNVGALKPAKHRPSLDVENFGWDSLDLLEEWVVPEVWDRYEEAACEILEYLEDGIQGESFIRIHGDCHKGNILQTDPREGRSEYFFVDFDDFINGLPVQDFWMLFSSDESGNREELDEFLKGYEELRLFNESHLDLMGPLRGLRIIYYAAWIARRWTDPSFPKIFPEFRNYLYWAEEVEALEKIAWSIR